MSEVGWLEVGISTNEALPKDRLTSDERGELEALLRARAGFVERLSYLESKIELFLLAARDQRGLKEKVRINPETGEINGIGG